MMREQYLTGHMPWEGGEDEKAYICPVCGAEEPEKFYIDDIRDCVGCSECISEADFPDGRDFL